MKVVSKAGAGAALVVVALLPYFAGYTSAPALAQYDVVPPEGQYDLPAEGQYAPPASTTTLPEYRSGETTQDRIGGGNTNGDGATTPAGGDGGDEAATEPPERRRPEGDLPRLFDGFLPGAAAFLVVLSLVTTLFFFLERREDRRGA